MGDWQRGRLHQFAKLKLAKAGHRFESCITRHTIMNFTIDPDHLCSVTHHTLWNMYRNKENPTEEDLVKVLKGKGDCSSYSSDDHPEFKKLRDELEASGFIKTQRGWWNGDSVLKPFSINGAKFRKNEQFSSGAAIRHTIESKLTKK